MRVALEHTNIKKKDKVWVEVKGDSSLNGIEFEVKESKNFKSGTDWIVRVGTKLSNEQRVLRNVPDYFMGSMTTFFGTVIFHFASENSTMLDLLVCHAIPCHASSQYS